MKNKKTIMVSVIVLLVALLGVFSYNTFLKEKPVDGAKKVTVYVINEGTDYKKEHIINTDEESLGDALDVAGLIGYDKQPTGRFLNTVDDITADANKQQWWNVIINGENAQVGIDDIMIKDGDKVELTLKTGW